MARTRSGKNTTTAGSSTATTTATTSPSTTTAAAGTASSFSSGTSPLGEVSASTAAAATAVRRRRQHRAEDDAVSSEKEKGKSAAASAAAAEVKTAGMSWAARNQWVVLAVASGACAAFNGVFAKLTTNDLTTHISQGISRFFGLSEFEGVLEVVVRCMFFGLNLVFNGVMWTLFTKALARGSSTTQVSIMNTSTNFVVTALLGLAVFAESLPPLWWAGAALLVAGNVIIGRKDNESGATATANDGCGDDDDGDIEIGSPSEEAGRQENGSGSGNAGYGTVARGEQGVEGLLVPVEKDIDEEEEEEEVEDEDVPLLGDLEGAHTR
ncbi:hypothetical protein F5X99DRAFT_392627 [Biscogniauxia marginata]|nr:hypothetical protein F5X99DRAFT_392627 [Biscogniauxia marginata]